MFTKTFSLKTKYNLSRRCIVTHTTSGRQWTQFLRFLDESGKVVWGEPTDATYRHAKLITDGFVTETVVEVTSVLSPIVPTNIIGIGLNYKRHAEEAGLELPKYPIVFQKNLSSVTSHGKNIIVPKAAKEQVDFEAELAVVIGQECKNVDKENALSYVLGYTCANDVSARIWQGKRGGGQWSYGKSFDTFCPLGPILVSPQAIPNPNDLAITCTVNGEVMQESNTKEMIFDVAALISFLSQDTTLTPGTVILTGTPDGVGFTRNPPVYLREGDVVTVEIERIGKLTNTVMD